MAHGRRINDCRNIAFRSAKGDSRFRASPKAGGTPALRGYFTASQGLSHVRFGFSHSILAANTALLEPYFMGIV